MSTTVTRNSDGLHFEYHSSYFSKTEADRLHDGLEKEIAYLPPKATTIRFPGGVERAIPRKVAAYGDDGIVYRFSGRSFKGKPWTPTLTFLKRHADGFLQPQQQRKFNYALVNRYKDGNHSISAHADNEKDLNPRYPIVSFSFGATRRFVFRRKGFEKHVLELEHGSVLVMNPPTNAFWTHEIPKEKKVATTGARTNVTFRRLEQPGF